MVDGIRGQTLLVASPMGELVRLQLSSSISMCDCGQHFTADSWGQLVAENKLPAMLASSYEFQFATLHAWRGKFKDEESNNSLSLRMDYQ